MSATVNWWPWPRARGKPPHAFAERHQIPRAHAGYDALIADPQVDAVYVATPHTLHLAHSAAALRAGKAVLCEKPLTTSLTECEALVDIARRSGSYLMEGMWTYFLPAIQVARRWVAEGRIGRIRHIKADFGYPLLPFDATRREYDATLAGGCLLEMGIYPIALAWLFLEQDPTSVQVVARHAPNGVEDDVAMLFEYALLHRDPGNVVSRQAAELGLRHRRGWLHRDSRFLACAGMHAVSTGRTHRPFR